MPPLIRISIHEHAGTIILNRPEKRNALNRAMLGELSQALGDLQRVADGPGEPGEGVDDQDPAGLARRVEGGLERRSIVGPLPRDARVFVDVGVGDRPALADRP